MRLYTAVVDHMEQVLVSVDGGKQAYTAAALGLQVRDMNQVITTPGLADQLRSAAKNAAAVLAVPVAELKLCAPVPVPLQDVVCLGINYDEHAVEAGRFSGEAFGGERPYTIYFSKRVNRATADGEAIPAYTGLVDSLDYECELGVILGKDVKGISRDHAEEAVFGYTIINDISARNLQTRHKQWYLGKSLDGFTPMGPCIVTPDELGDAKKLGIRSFVNGEPRQHSNTRYMIQTTAGAISELSAGMTLKAGTIIATGTPAGVGMGMVPPCFLKPGDTVTCEIDGIGSITNPIA